MPGNEANACTETEDKDLIYIFKKHSISNSIACRPISLLYCSMHLGMKSEHILVVLDLSC